MLLLFTTDASYQCLPLDITHTIGIHHDTFCGVHWLQPQYSRQLRMAWLLPLLCWAAVVLLLACQHARVGLSKLSASLHNSFFYQPCGNL
jgi:hypothetical protein